MTVLVTGVAGLIGSNFAWWLTENTEHRVVGVDNLSCGLKSNLPEIARLYVTTIGEGNNLDRVFASERPTHVYHFAAYAAEGLSPWIRRYNYTNNLVATADVVNCCLNHGVERLVYTSSMAVYGRGEPPFGEADPCQPIDPYGVAKLAAERDIQIAGEQHGLDWTIIRPHNVYGSGQVYDQRYRNVLTIWMSRYLRGLPLLIFGDGSQRRAFSFVGDCLEPLYRAGFGSDSARQIINLGGSSPVSIHEAADLCRDMLPGARIEHCEPRHEVADAWCTTEKSRRLLGYEDRTPLADGLQDLWDWLSRQPADNEPPTMDLELRLRPYSPWITPDLSRAV